MITIPVYVIFLVFLGILMGLELNRRKKNRYMKRIKELEEKLKLLRSELDELHSVKSEMMSRIGLSLRKPLDSLRNTALELSKPLERSPAAKQHLSRLTEEVMEIEKFLDVVKELDALENIDITAMEDSSESETVLEVTLDSLLFDVLDSWNNTLSEKGISMALSIDGDVRVRGSRRYLRLALENMISEITRGMAPDSLVHITMTKDGDLVKLSMVHKGERKEEVEKSAFGSELARQIVNAHGGWLRFESESSTYAAELPLCSKEEKSANE
ncbi:MAG: hypothetical protein GF388_01215 [Candidatus Aegiribacteria sp.]|nr:hypothetical protein [Candidatus Aegiribacteria sp.]MBD3294001.1 hypothetical protein [Candidatus Fermentibacteria bacterium]